MIKFHILKNNVFEKTSKRSPRFQSVISKQPAKIAFKDSRVRRRRRRACCALHPYGFMFIVHLRYNLFRISILCVTHVQSPTYSNDNLTDRSCFFLFCCFLVGWVNRIHSLKISRCQWHTNQITNLRKTRLVLAQVPLSP